MKIRDRIKELRRVLASQLQPHPKNWRRHPPAQHDALRGMLAEIGYANALLARETEDGTLMLIDGHLRAETTPDIEVPVLILDVTAEEADKLLALHDPLGALAETDTPLLAELAERIETESEALRTLLKEITAGDASELLSSTPGLGPDVEIPASFQVIVDCRDEQQQQIVYQRLKSEGFSCRVITV